LCSKVNTANFTNLGDCRFSGSLPSLLLYIHFGDEEPGKQKTKGGGEKVQEGTKATEGREDQAQGGTILILKLCFIIYGLQKSTIRSMGQRLEQYIGYIYRAGSIDTCIHITCQPKFERRIRTPEIVSFKVAAKQNKLVSETTCDIYGSPNV